MAALLRSARLLKMSPSGLLHIAGTKRTGVPLSRLYNGAAGVSRTAACSRLIRPGNVSSSRVWPYTWGCVRGYTLATDKLEVEDSLALRSKQAQHFDLALARLDSSVRRTGRIPQTLLLSIFHDICKAGHPSGNQALLLLRGCGSLLPEVPPQERTDLAHLVWQKLQEMGALFDVSHYNALLKVYLQNEFKFSPTDFLAKMEAADVQPNRVTYQRLLAAYCENGDIEGASTILGFMKSQDLPITEAVFNSLVTGHARAGDIDSAKNILSVMEGAGIEPGPDTYVSLLSAYAEKGEMDSVKRTMEEAESADFRLMDRDIMQVIFTMARFGHQQHIPELVECLRHEKGCIPDVTNHCLSLITHGHEDTAFLIFKKLVPDSIHSDSANLGNFFLRHCVNMDKPVEKIWSFCKELQESNLHSTPFAFSLRCALELNKSGMALELMKLSKEQGFPIRLHYFYPLLRQILNNKDSAGLMEVLKRMQDFGLSPDDEIFTTFICPHFESTEEAQKALMDEGITVSDSKPDWIPSLSFHNLAKAYTRLSDPSFPSLDCAVFRTRLIRGFIKSHDVESMVKLTELLYKDDRFANDNSSPPEVASYFLYNLFNNMTDAELQAREDILRKYLNQLHIQNIHIPFSIFKGIKKILESRFVPELIKDVFPLVQKNLSTDSELALSHNFDNVPQLEKKLAELEAENKPLEDVLKQTIQALCFQANLERALELKQQYEDAMTSGSYAILIQQCCHQEKEKEAIDLKHEMTRKDSSSQLDASKCIALVKLLSKNGKVEDAVDILKEMKEKDIKLRDSQITMLFHTLNSLVPNPGAPAIQRLLETIFTLGLAKPSTNLCSPLISAYLNNDDMSGALEASLECQKRFKVLPRLHDILVGLVKKGDTEHLQKVMDSVSQERGEMNMLYDLFFAFLKAGRTREARKIIETPGLRSRPGRLEWFAEKCISANKMVPLEQMVDITAKLFECDRDEMYTYILRLCQKTNNWEKAEEAWLKMQEENIIPRERTLRLLADVLKNNGREVPFEMPEIWFEDSTNKKQDNAAKTPTTPTPTSTPTTPDSTSTKDPKLRDHLLSLCKKGSIEEAYSELKKANEVDAVLSPVVYDTMIRSFLAVGNEVDAVAVYDIARTYIPGFELSVPANNMLIITYSTKGQLEDALQKLRSMSSLGQVPSHLSIIRLVQALGRKGDLAGIQEVETTIQNFGANFKMPSMTFVNNKALAHIKNDEIDLGIELLESFYTSPDATNPDGTSPSMSYVFGRLLDEDNEKACDKLSAMAERLANHFACYRPATDLFLHLLEKDRVEDAKFMLARCNAVAEQKAALISFLSRKAGVPGQLDKIKTLASLIPDFTEKEMLYQCFMKCHSRDKDLAAAKALYEQSQREGVVINELSLKRLAALYKEAGEEVPFEEPPKSYRFYADKLKDRAAKAKAAEEE